MNSKFVYILSSIAVIIGAIYFLLDVIQDEEETETEKDPEETTSESVPNFIPTHEWQEVLPKQPIPPVLNYLHYRYFLGTCHPI